MSTPARLIVPPELVFAAWIASIPGFNPDVVATVLPSDSTTWAANGAVIMFTVGGTEGTYIAVSDTVCQVECWACNPGGNEPPWLMAEGMAGQIRLACLDRPNLSRPLTIAQNKVAYPGASVRGAQVLTVARRVYGASSDYAGIIFDLYLTWTQDGLITR